MLEETFYVFYQSVKLKLEFSELWRRYKTKWSIYHLRNKNEFSVFVVELHIPLGLYIGCQKTPSSTRYPGAQNPQSPEWTDSPASHSDHWPSLWTWSPWRRFPDQRPSLCKERDTKATYHSQHIKIGIQEKVPPVVGGPTRMDIWRICFIKSSYLLLWKNRQCLPHKINMATSYLETHGCS